MWCAVVCGVCYVVLLVLLVMLVCVVWCGVYVVCGDGMGYVAYGVYGSCSMVVAYVLCVAYESLVAYCSACENVLLCMCLILGAL